MLSTFTISLVFSEREINSRDAYVMGKTGYENAVSFIIPMPDVIYQVSFTHIDYSRKENNHVRFGNIVLAEITDGSVVLLIAHAVVHNDLFSVGERCFADHPINDAGDSERRVVYFLRHILIPKQFILMPDLETVFSPYDAKMELA